MTEPVEILAASPFRIEIHPGDVVIAFMETEMDEITKEQIMAFRDIVESSGGGKKMRVITVIRRFNVISPEGRDWSASDEGQKFTMANAIVVESVAAKIGANFYVRFANPATPTRVFNDLPSAVKWIRNVK
jgi:hypothetical protein